MTEDPEVLSTMRALDEVRSVGSLAYVPDAIRAGASIEGLFMAEARGYVELRPESGVGLLSKADAALAPKTRRGDVLSYARIKKMPRF